MAVKAYPHQKFALSAKNHRNLSEEGVGVVDPGDLSAAAGSGYASSITAGRTRLRSVVGGSYQGGLYEIFNDSTLALTHTTPGASARIDQIVARVSDITDLASGVDLAEIAIVTGSAVGGTLDNRTGATALAANEQLLWDVLVPNGAGSAASFTYRDRRPYAADSIIPKALSGGTFDAVMFEPVGDFGLATLDINAANYQGAALMYLSKPITATRIRWAYRQGSTAATGNYTIAIFDASGRKIVDTGSVAFTGATTSYQARSETISSTRFEAGMYYVFIGTTIATASSQLTYKAYSNSSSTPHACPGMFRWASTGGITVPTTLLGLTEGQSSLPAQPIPVPIVSLANG